MPATYRELDAWNAGMVLVTHCYEMTRQFGREERFGLAGQIRRAAVSIPSNIAEGSCRKSAPMFRHHVSIALGSHAELETCFEIAKRLGYLGTNEYTELANLCARTGQLLNGLYRSLK
jgi:four helix bundle protein